jgi:hypothetical protein
MKKIYDCFTFYNELDLLELRLEEHYDYVDYFVIAEANKTHQGRDKIYYLEENWDRYAKYHDKIIHIKVDDMPTNDNAWVLENYQRNALAKGYVDADDNDIIVISDLDEVMRAETFELMREDDQHTVFICRCPLFYFKVNYIMVKPKSYWVNGMAMPKKFMTSPQDLRNLTHWASAQPEDLVTDKVMTIQHAGWHFTYLGNTDHAKNKIVNFAHQESNHLADTMDVEEFMKLKKGIDPNNPNESFDIVTLDDYFPETIINNLERWKDYIASGESIDIKNFVPNWETA